MELKYSFILRNLDKTLAIVGVIFSLILIAYLCREIGHIVYILTGIMALVSCLLWLLIRRTHSFKFPLLEYRTLTIFLIICFFLLYILSLLSVHSRPDLYSRPLLYFVLTAVMAGIVACETLTSSKRYTNLVLIQIILLGLSIAWSQLLIFPSLIGIDPWYHSVLTNQIIDESFIPESYSYSKFPLFHLMIAATSIMINLPYKFATMASISLGQVICNVVFIFLITNKLFRNHRVGLLAALLVIIANRHIYMCYWIIPNGFGVVFIPIVFYLLITEYKRDSQLAPNIVCMILFVAIILTHTIAAICMAILLFVAWCALIMCGNYFDVKNYIPLMVPVGFIATVFAWWTYASGIIGTLGQYLKWGFSIDIFMTTPEGFRDYSLVVPLGEQLFNNIGMFLFFAISFIGIFYMISCRGSGSTFSMAWVSFTPLAIGFFSLITGHSVIENRWWYLAQILLSIPLAVAIYIIGTWKIRNRNSILYFIFGFVVVLSFFMIMSPIANIDNPMFSPNTNWRATPIESELHAGTILDYYDGVVKSDNYYASRLGGFGYNTRSFCEEVGDRNVMSMKGDLVLVRDAVLEGPFMFFSGIYKLDYRLDDLMESAGFRQVYDSGSVYAYL